MHDRDNFDQNNVMYRQLRPKFLDTHHAIYIEPEFTNFEVDHYTEMSPLVQIAGIGDVYSNATITTYNVKLLVLSLKA